VGFLFSKKKPNLFVFIFENKKDKILAKNLGFYACSGFLSGTHGVNPSFSAKRNLQHCCGFFIFQKKTKLVCVYF
jgi:hypothetical protein